MIKYAFDINGKIGFLSETGDELFPAQFDGDFLGSVSFDNDVAVISKKGKKGLMSIEGEVLVPFEFNDIRYRGHNMVLVQNDGLYGYFGINQKILQVPCIYKSATVFVKGIDYAGVKFNDKYGLISNNGQVASEFIYDNIDVYIAGIVARKNGKYGVLNANLEIISPFVYDYCFGLSDNIFLIEYQGKCGLLNKKGVMIVPPIYNKLGICTPRLIELQKAGCSRVFDCNGKPFHSGLLSKVYYIDGGYRFFHSGMGRIYGDGKYGFIDYSNKEVIRPTYENADEFEGEYAPVMLNGKWGVINKRGEKIVPFIYDKIEIKGDFFKVSNGKIEGREYLAPYWEGKWGLLNCRGEILRPMEFREYDFKRLSDKLMTVHCNGCYSLLSTDGDIVSGILSMSPTLYNDMLEITSGGLHAIIKSNGEIIIPYIECTSISFLNMKTIGVGTDDGYYVMDITNGKKTEPIYFNVQSLGDGNFILTDSSGSRIYDSLNHPISQYYSCIKKIYINNKNMNDD